MQERRLGSNGITVSALGLGCMGMSGMYGPADARESIATIHAALDAGVTLLDTGDFYGMGHNELLIAEALRGRDRDAVPDQRQVRRACAAPAAAGAATTPGRPRCKNFLAYTLTRLGIDHIDIYRPARLDPTVPIEETIGAIAELVKAGYVRHIGLSEVGAETIRRAARRAPDRRPADRVLADLARDRGRDPADLPRARHRHHRLRRALARPAQRPLAPDRELARGDFRAHSPRFQGENLERNLALVERAARGRRTSAASPSPSSRSPGCWRRATTSCRWSARARRERLAEALGALELELDRRRPRRASRRRCRPARPRATATPRPQMAMLDSER